MGGSAKLNCKTNGSAKWSRPASRLAHVTVSKFDLQLGLRWGGGGCHEARSGLPPRIGIWRISE